MKQRLCLARALVHNPDILFLDEPASGLDPKARYELKEILRSLSSMGKTIVISSHILPELAEMCTSYGIIDHGIMKMSGSMRDIQSVAHISQMPIAIVVNGKEEETVQLLRQMPGTQFVRTMAEGRIEVNYAGGRDEEVALLKNLIANDIPVISYGRMEGTLENVFLNLMDAPMPQAPGPQPGMQPQMIQPQVMQAPPMQQMPSQPVVNPSQQKEGM